MQNSVPQACPRASSCRTVQNSVEQGPRGSGRCSNGVGQVSPLLTFCSFLLRTHTRDGHTSMHGTVTPRYTGGHTDARKDTPMHGRTPRCCTEGHHGDARRNTTVMHGGTYTPMHGRTYTDARKGGHTADARKDGHTADARRDAPLMHGGMLLDARRDATLRITGVHDGTPLCASTVCTTGHLSAQSSPGSTRCCMRRVAQARNGAVCAEVLPLLHARGGVCAERCTRA